MQNLQPIEAYLENIGTSWRHAGWIIGAAWGIVMAAAIPLIVSIAHGRLTGTALTVGILASVAAAWIFGVSWSRSMARTMKGMAEAAYAGTPPFDVDVPPGGYSHRLPASLRISDRIAVGGVLFLGRSVITFVPHRLNLSVHRNPSTFDVDGEFGLELVAQHPGLFRRLLFGTLPKLVSVTSQGTRWLLLVPRPADTADKIRNVVGA